jgi:hypothetical protein
MSSLDHPHGETFNAGFSPKSPLRRLLLHARSVNNRGSNWGQIIRAPSVSEWVMPRDLCMADSVTVAAQEAAADGKKAIRKTGTHVPKTVLRLPDLDQAKSAVLDSLSSKDVQRGYRHAIDEFHRMVLLSEPRLSFSKSVVLRYRIHLESPELAPGTVNLRLGPVRRLAYKAADCGLLNPDLAAGIRRVKGVKKIGVRLGNWLTPEQSVRLRHADTVENLTGERDRALLAVLLACGLRRQEPDGPYS